MNILFYDFGSYTYRDIHECLTGMGHIVNTFYYHMVDKYDDLFFEERFLMEISENRCDLVFSVNFFPIVARICSDAGIMYASWSYDSPLEERLKDYFGYDTNLIFLFDRAEVSKYQNLGYKNVFHMPLAVNVKRLDSLSFSDAVCRKFSSDISFVGSMYDKPLDALLCFADDYVRGFTEAVFQAQFNVYGANLVETAISDRVINRINDSIASAGQKNILLTGQGLSYAILKQITSVERSLYAEGFSEQFDFKLYTADVLAADSAIKSFGPVKYYSEMPAVFRNSKINLAPTLRSIVSGIPLRHLDIMGAGGCLLSNYQPELLEYFEDGEDVIIYTSFEEAFDKAAYYLKNDELRKKIAEKGHEKVRDQFGYERRLSEILRMATE